MDSKRAILILGLFAMVLISSGVSTKDLTKTSSNTKKRLLNKEISDAKYGKAVCNPGYRGAATCVRYPGNGGGNNGPITRTPTPGNGGGSNNGPITRTPTPGNRGSVNCPRNGYRTCLPGNGQGGGRQYCPYGCCSNRLSRTSNCEKCCSYAGEAVDVQTKNNAHN